MENQSKQRNYHLVSDKRHLNEYINQRRIKNPACTVQALPFIPRQARSPFTPIESRPFSSGDSRFFRFVESCYTYTYSPNRGTGHKSLYLVVVFPERWNSKEAHLAALRRVLALHVGWAVPRWAPSHNATAWPVYTGIGRDPGVSEVRPHPALCPAHVTIVLVVIRVNVCPMNPSTTSCLCW